MSAAISAFVQRLDEADLLERACLEVGRYISHARLQLAGSSISDSAHDQLLSETDRRMTKLLQEYRPDLIPEWQQLYRTLWVEPVPLAGVN